MARARNIKPGLYKNEDLAECSIWARYLFPGLWMLADREGRQEDRPKRIKAELLPFDTQDVEPLLRELAEKKDKQGAPFIVRYRNSDGAFIQISKFLTHQTPHYSEKQSVIKPPTLQETNGHIEPHDSAKTHVIKGVPQPPDSLIPDSLIPEKKTSLSGKPDIAPNGVRQQAIEILAFLNEKTSKHFRPVDSTLKPIIARLKEGFSPDDLRSVIANKYRQWTGNEKMNEYLRPKTLFNATNFANYEGQLGNAP